MSEAHHVKQVSLKKSKAGKLTVSVLANMVLLLLEEILTEKLSELFYSRLHCSQMKKGTMQQNTK